MRASSSTRSVRSSGAHVAAHLAGHLGLAHLPLPVGRRRHLRQVGDAHDLMAAPQLLEHPAHDLGHPPADAGIHLVEHQGWHLRHRAGNSLNRQAQLATARRPMQPWPAGAPRYRGSPRPGTRHAPSPPRFPPRSASARPRSVRRPWPGPASARSRARRALAAARMRSRESRLRGPLVGLRGRRARAAPAPPRSPHQPSTPMRCASSASVSGKRSGATRYFRDGRVHRLEPLLDLLQATGIQVDARAVVAQTVHGLLDLDLRRLEDLEALREPGIVLGGRAAAARRQLRRRQAPRLRLRTSASSAYSTASCRLAAWLKRR